MGIFKKKMSKEDIIAAINALPEEEQAELFEEIVAELEEQDGANDTEATEQTQETSDANDEGTQEPQEAQEEPKLQEEQESKPVEEKQEDVEEIESPTLDESNSESERVEAEDGEEVKSALGARISTLEEQLATISERIEQMLSNLENQDFGAQHGGGAEKPANEDDEAYMDAYYAKQQRRK